MWSERIPFTCRRATFHFMYSFIPELKDPAKSVPEVLTEADTPEIRAQLGLNATIGVGLPQKRRGIAPYLSLAPDSAWVTYDTRRATFGDQPIMVTPLIRHFAAGATCTFQMELQSELESLKTATLLKALKLNAQQGSDGQKSENWVKYDDGQGPDAGLYFAFQEIVKRYTNVLPVVWTDVSERLLDTSVEDQQNPWVVTVAEVDGAVADAFCEQDAASIDPAETKILRVRPYQRDVGALVFRSVADDLVLEPAYLQSPNARSLPGLFSVNIDSRLFVCMSRRSILCVCRDRDKDAARYFLPALLDICEVVRAQWHALVGINRCMDHAMREFIALKKDGVYFRRLLQTLRMKLANSLEDPMMYVVAGDAISRIVDELGKIFRIEELRFALLRKMELIDKLYSDARQLAWFRNSGLDADAEASE
jgi:hypothetical protein